MNIALSFCLYRRVAYTGRIMEAAAKIPEFAGLPAVVSIDRYNAGIQAELMSIAAKFFPQATIDLKDSKVGCNVNTRSAISAAFGTGADFVFHIEDDILLSPDAGQWVKWAAENFRDDPGIFTVSTWRHASGWHGRSDIPPEQRLQAKRQPFFCCWGWGTWRDRWDEILANWTPDTTDSHDLSWDVVVGRTRGPSRCEIAPMVSRAQNIGSDFGTHRGCCILPSWQTERTSGQYVCIE